MAAVFRLHTDARLFLAPQCVCPLLSAAAVISQIRCCACSDSSSMQSFPPLRPTALCNLGMESIRPYKGKVQHNKNTECFVSSHKCTVEGFANVTHRGCYLIVMAVCHGFTQNISDLYYFVIANIAIGYVSFWFITLINSIQEIKWNLKNSNCVKRHKLCKTENDLNNISF